MKKEKNKKIVSSRVSAETLRKILIVAKKNKWTVSFTVEQMLEYATDGIK